MGELGNIWLYQDDADDLKMKLQKTRMELEEVRQEVNLAKEQTREKEKQLHDILKMVYKERDEAREQLHNLLNKINPSPNVSSTLSDTYNNLNNSNQSYVSSPVDSIFDAVTSPEFSTLNMDCDAYVQDICMSQTQALDHATVVIDALVKAKKLPQKGKFLEAMMEAGPLLQTLMLAGPLPTWRNPPPLQPFKIKQMAAISAVSENHHPIEAAPLKPGWTPFTEMSCGSSSHMETNYNNISMLNFSNGGVNNGGMNTQIPVGKRQRLMYTV